MKNEAVAKGNRVSLDQMVTNVSYQDDSIKREEDPGLIVVGIGASAGGLEALQKTLPSLPSGLTYVVAQHLAPSHQSVLDELLAKCTHLAVETVGDGVAIRADTVYIAPPDKDVFLDKGRLRLIEAFRLTSKPSIDAFFQSLAEDKKGLAVGVILSGTGSDGAYGIRTIRANNGVTIVQQPESAKFDGMPKAALQTGCVDYVLAPEQIGIELKSMADSLLASNMVRDPSDSELSALHEILLLINRKTNIDFTSYRLSTMYRRITRRAGFHKIETIEEYLEYLKSNPEKIECIVKDLLISVTNFFRDKEAFSALTEVLRIKLQSKRPHEPIRIWVPACSTGEEAYSIAIIISELLKEDAKNCRVQIFATDIDDDSIQWARRGVYPIAAVAAERNEIVDQYFDRLENMVSVKRELRDMLVLAKQDLTRDTPFLHLDLISCRNFFIYIENDLQEQLLSLFHFSLDPEGLLFLGKSESISRKPELFTPLDKKWKIFKRVECLTNHPPHRFQGHSRVHYTNQLILPRKPEKSEIWKEREFATSLLKILDCCAIATDQHGNIQYIRGDVGPYLKLPDGSVRDSLNAISMARQEIRSVLYSVLNRIKSDNNDIVYRDIEINEYDLKKNIRICAGKIRESDKEYYIILFFNHKIQDNSNKNEFDNVKERESEKVIFLENEIKLTRQSLHDIMYEFEESSSELQLLNEELQSTNEELHASNEELGTSNEELHASNEELYTINEELRNKSEELAKVIQQLEESEKKYRLLVEHANSAIIRWKADGTISFFNEYAQKFFGYEPHEVIGKNVGILVPSQDSVGQNLSQLVQDIIATPEKYTNNINENICSDGKRVWMTWSNKPIFDEDGQVTEILAVGSDITRQKAAEEQLRRSEKDLRESQQRARLGSWRLNITTNEVTWTEELFRMFNLDPALPPPQYDEHSRLFTQNSWHILSTSLSRTIESGEPYELELQTVRQGGGNGWIWVRGEVERDETNAIVSLWGAAQDITERKQFESKMHLLAQQRQLALDAAHLGWWQYNPVTKISTWDDGYRTIFGVEGYDKPNDQILQQIIHPEDLPALWERVESALSPEHPEKFYSQYRIIRPDGELRWIEAHGIATFDGTGASRHAVDFVGTVADITQRKQAEAKLAENDALHRAILRNLPFDFWARDLSQNVLMQSDASLRFWGDLSGTSLETVRGVDEETLARWHRNNQSVLEGKIVSEQCSYVSKDGVLRDFHGILAPMWDGGSILGIIGINIDITEKNIAEQALRESEERLQLVMEGSRLGYWDWDIAIGEVRRNKHWAEMLGYTLEEIECNVTQWTDLHHPDDREAAWKSLQDHLHGITPEHRIEYRMLAKDGQYKWILDQARVVKRDAQGQPLRMCGTHTDISARKQEEAEKQLLQTQLLHSQKMEAIGTLAGGIAHDFNNILGAILGFAEMAKEDSLPGSRASEEIDRVIEAGHRAAGLVKQILAFSRQAGSESVPINPEHIIQEAIKLLRPGLPSTIAISQQSDGPLHTIIADPTQIHQLVMNLCTNAYHAMERTGGSLHIQLENQELTAHDVLQYPHVKPGDFIVLSVSDTGTGIAPEIRDRIFDPYFTSKEVGKGTGMGLAIVHGIVTSLGGFVTCNSTLGQGTVFRVFFPASTAEVVLPTVSTEVLPTGKEHVLYVDDEEILAELGKTMLERLGYHVTLCTDSVTAFTLFREHPGRFDILITDQTMPRMTGFDLARNILEIRPNFPIILCTGYSNLVDEEAAKQAGIKGFIMKPLTKKGLADLLAAIKNEGRPTL